MGGKCLALHAKLWRKPVRRMSRGTPMQASPSLLSTVVGPLLTALIALPLLAQNPPATPPATPDLSRPHIAYEKYTLPNGLQVILVPDHRVPTVFVALMFHVGSKDEPVGSSGLAHLFEHMMFEGSKTAPGEYMQ